MADDSPTGTFRLSLPQELISEASRHHEPKPEKLQVEGWRTSWLSRLSEFLIGKE